jgi:dCMP deaminase
MSIKPTWDEYFVNMLDAVATRASCDRGRSAAILTRNNRILSTGYVGAPTGLPTCDDEGHIIERRILVYGSNHISEHCIRTFHAEMNAILGCAREGVSTINSTLYCNMVPCRNCGMAVIQAGITRVVAKNKYQKDEETRKMFELSHIELVVLDENTTY